MRSLLLLLSLMASLPLMATDTNSNTNTETDYRNHVQWAKDSINHNQHKPGFTGFDVNALCKDAACQRDVANPAPSRYINNASALRADARGEASRNEQSQAVTASFNKGRPTIDENDPAYHAAIGYQNDAYNISHGISSKYHDCDKGLRCDLSSTPRRCTRPTHSAAMCEVTPYLKSSSVENRRRSVSLSGSPYPNVSFRRRSVTVNSFVFSSDILAPAPTQSLGEIQSLQVTINGISLGSAPVSPTIEPCSQSTCTYKLDKTFNQKIHGSSFQLGVLAKFERQSTPINVPISFIVLTFIYDRVNIAYRNSCSPLLPQCQRIQSQCVEGKATRLINDVLVTLNCWKETQTYQCNSSNTCTTLSHCTVQSSTCKTRFGGVCIEEQQQRQCETQRCQDVGLVCGEDSFALSGDYYEPSASQSPDFNHAAAGLAAIGEAGQDVKDKANINENSAIIFKGDIMRCSIKAIGLSNCCQDSGWGNDIGIVSCSEEEKALGSAKEDKLTISLGQYCAEKILGMCIRKKKSYCAFSSKLARIVQEEGKVQLGLNFGSAKHPDCRAFTPNQLQHIDMNQMDFSDFYEDLHEGMDLPDTDEIKRRLQRTVGGNS